MFPKKLILVLFSFTLLFLFNFQNIFACSPYPKLGLPDAFEHAETIVIARIAAIEEIAENENFDDYPYKGYSKMIVEKIYKGDAKVGDELIFGQGIGPDCYWSFSEKMIGEKFLLYTMRNSFMPNIHFNSGVKYLRLGGRSNYLNFAANDLLFLDKIDRVLGQTRLSGTLKGFEVKGSGFANRQIKIVGKDKVYKTKTDKNGVFEIYDLPPGEYLVEPEIPDKLKLRSFSFIQGKFNFNQPKYNEKVQIPVELEEKGHEELELYFSIDNSIRGKVLSPTGYPVTDIQVTAIQADEKDYSHLGDWNLSNTDGSFEISSLYPGNYIIVINKSGKVIPEKPYGRTFYPGVTDKKNAKVVSIDFGQFLNDINIQIPKAEEFMEISGRVLYSNKTPVNEGIVSFETFEENSRAKQNTGVRTDKQGRFSLKILKNVRGKLYGEVDAYSDKFDNCREYVLTMAQEEITYVKTNEIVIQENMSLTKFELILPFSGCP